MAFRCRSSRRPTRKLGTAAIHAATPGSGVGSVAGGWSGGEVSTRISILWGRGSLMVKKVTGFVFRSLVSLVGAL